MKITYQPSVEEVKELRKKEYLKDWSIDSQLEALSESAMGRPEKLNAMIADFKNIRERLPFSENKGDI